MLPPGHVAAGFLVTESLLRVMGSGISASQQWHLVLWGMFFSFAPDLDTFYSFVREKSFTVRNPQVNDHRKYLSHAPALWMIAGLLIYLLVSVEFWKIFGIILWVATWSHFILDSIEAGIMWLWPFSEKKLTLRKVPEMKIVEEGFWGYWIMFLKLYCRRYTFYFEIIILAAALLTAKNLYF